MIFGKISLPVVFLRQIAYVVPVIVKSIDSDTELAQIAERLELATKAAGAGVWDYDIPSRRLTWDEQMHRLYGIEASCFGETLDSWLALVHPEDSTRVRHEIQLAESGEKKFFTEFRVVWSDGTVHVMRGMALVKRNDNGQAVRVVGTNWDITERRLEQDALLLSEARFRKFFEFSILGKGIISPERTWLAVNDKTCEILGCDRVELIGHPCAARIHRDDSAAATHQFDRIFSGIADGYCGDVRFLRDDGSVVWTELSIGCVRNAGGRLEQAVCVISDITERTATTAALLEREEQLAASNARYNDLVQKLPVGIYTLRIDVAGASFYEYVSSRFCSMLGLTAADLLRDPSLAHAEIHRDDFAGFKAAKLIATHDGATLNWEGRARVNGAMGWMRIEAERTILSNGDVLWNGVISDITAKKRVEDEMSSLRTVVEQTANTIVITNPVGTIEYVNPAFVKSTGYSFEEAIGQNPKILKSGGQPDDFYKDLWITISAGKIWRGEFHNRRKNGELFWERVTISPVTDETGKIVHYIAIKEDVTERKKNESAIRSLNKEKATILDSVPAMIWYKDCHNRFVWANRAAGASLGMKQEDVAGASAYDIFPMDAAKYYEDDQEVISTKAAKFGILESLTGTSGDSKWVFTDKVPCFNENGDVTGIIVFSVDITDRMVLEASLRDALARANAATQSKSAFLSMMSHELRTPLNGVLGFADLLSRTPLSDDQKTCTETIIQSGEHLLAVVNDVLDFSKNEGGKLEIVLETFGTAAFIEEIVCSFQEQAVGKGIDLTFSLAPDVPQQFTGDKRRIRQILFNLIGNAVKFTDGGNVDVRIARDGQMLLTTVVDSGIGIAADMLPHLFKPFVQADSAINRRFGGTGLGLAISQQLAAAMGGGITASSTPGEGSTFTLRIPLGQSPVYRDGGSELPENLLQKPKKAILIVDDDATGRLLASRILESLGYATETAADGEQAVKVFAPDKYAAIFMDMQMPVVDGLEATRIIRKLEKGARVPIIALTANVMPEHRELCFEAGMDSFLAKPFKRDGIVAALEEIEAKQSGQLALIGDGFSCGD